jgi:hypothetical protein
MPTLASSRTPYHSNKARKRNKRHVTEKENVKLSLFSENMIFQKENLKNLPENQKSGNLVKLLDTKSTHKDQ